MGDAGATMAATLLKWCGELAADDATTAGIARSIGEPVDGSSPTQLRVTPSDGAWSQAEIVSAPGDDEPSFVRLTPADPNALSVEALESAVGPPTTLPPKVHFYDPVSRIYQIDSGSPGHTAAVIAELPPEGGDHVAAVVLRRDIRL